MTVIWLPKFPQPCKGVTTMSQSLAKIVVHLVFSTKGRRQLLRDEERGELHATHRDERRDLASEQRTERATTTEGHRDAIADQRRKNKSFHLNPLVTEKP